EFENLMPFAIRHLVVGDPHVAAAIDGDAVRLHEQPSAETLQQFARRIEFENGREVRSGARIRAAAFGDPDVTVWSDIDGRGRSPRAPKLCPAFNGPIRIRLRIRLCVRLRVDAPAS